MSEENKYAVTTVVCAGVCMATVTYNTHISVGLLFAILSGVSVMSAVAGVIAFLRMVIA